MSGQVAQLHFFLFADGEAAPGGFRPDLDATMWWGRRDALARCTAAALFTYRRDSALPPPSSSSASPSPPPPPGAPTLSLYLAGDGALLRHMGDRFASAVPVPTERRLVAAWRAAAAGGGGGGAVIGGNGGGVPAGLACVRQAAVAGPPGGSSSSSSLSSAPASSSSSSSSSFSSSSQSAPSSSSLAGLGKRALVTHLQATLPLEALRRHRLNSSPAVVLKKATVPMLLAAHDAWLRETTTASLVTAVTAATTAANSAAVAPASAAAAASPTSAAGSSGSLAGSLAGPLAGPSVGPSGAVTESPAARAAGRALGSVLRGIDPREAVLLLLHEDFPEELYAAAAASAAGPTAVVAGVAGVAGAEGVAGAAGKESARGPLPVRHVVCVLGAVRDVSAEEEAGLSAAAARLGLRVAGANLGRTAEFTSKASAPRCVELRSAL